MPQEKSQEKISPSQLIVTQPLNSEEKIFGTIRPHQYNKIIEIERDRPAVPFPKGANLILVIEATGSRLRLPVDEHLQLGRKTPASVNPLLDLTPHGGFEQGVSRDHATLRRTSNDFLVVNDQASTCGTFLNGKQLMPLLRYVISSGDRLQLGRLILHVIYEPKG